MLPASNQVRNRYRKHYARGWCTRHYARWRDRKRRHTPGPPCSFGDCERKRVAKGLCKTHHQQLRRNGTLKPIKKPAKGCLVGNCAKNHYALGYCHRHYKRFKKHGDPLIVGKAPRGSGYINASGYRMIQRGDQQRPEHRWIMEEILERPLHDFENVHHINGIKTDNRPENLELWVRAQPSGQRAADLAKWVVEIYPELVEAHMNDRPQLRIVT